MGVLKYCSTKPTCFNLGYMCRKSDCVEAKAISGTIISSISAYGCQLKFCVVNPQNEAGVSWYHHHNRRGIMTSTSREGRLTIIA